MKKKLLKYGKILMALTLIGALTLPSYATVGAADGSAFVTKAEFDAALSDFNARLTTFEAGINSKIDSQVSSYLDRNGIWNGKNQTFDFNAYTEDWTEIYDTSLVADDSSVDVWTLSNDSTSAITGLRNGGTLYLHRVGITLPAATTTWKPKKWVNGSYTWTKNLFTAAKSGLMMVGAEISRAHANGTCYVWYSQTNEFFKSFNASYGCTVEHRFDIVDAASATRYLWTGMFTDDFGYAMTAHQWSWPRKYYNNGNYNFFVSKGHNYKLLNTISYWQEQVILHYNTTNYQDRADAAKMTTDQLKKWGATVTFFNPTIY